MSPESITALRLSLQVAVLATALNALVGIPIAYLLARRRFWGRVSWTSGHPASGAAAHRAGYYLIVLLGRRGGWARRSTT